MSTYTAPLRDMLFDLEHLAGIDEIAALPGFEDATLDTAAAVLEECARFNQDVIAPLNRDGDVQPSSWADGAVTTTPGFADAFRQFAAGGWQGLQHPVEFGGQGLPKAIGAACMEMLNSANLSFALCPLLSDGAIEALLTAGSAEQRQRYIPRLVSGEWTGTMNLTEPQAGSDLALVRSRAQPQPDGSYRIFGQKIFITYGEHDMADNIVHLVLARLPDAPAGVKGISLFIVPKILDDGRRNDVWCASIEHKLGIKASPTAVLVYGDDKGEVGAGAVGELIGEANRGLEYMFIMMNAARYAVGLQGVAVADRAYQKAATYARDRVQSRPVDGSAGAAVAIVHHPDVRRMLMTMRALSEGARALALYAAGLHDRGHALADAAQRAQAAADYEFLVPLVKGFSTEIGIEVASLGVQVHGGMGYIEETGAAQYYRDARILTIYEGTTAIQANDLVGRKTLRDGGAQAARLAAGVAATRDALAARSEPAAQHIAARLGEGLAAYEAVVRYMVEHRGEPNAAFAGSVPYLMLAGHLAAGWQLARGWLATQQPGVDAAFGAAKRATAEFFAAHLLPRAGALRDEVLYGADSVMALPADAF
ncbi:acyl-CoA dehydrogenase [mine drainage metagenome]|jgi:alkylation response protein AidB-like acyl-CoA dehydrogenase|uniref:Acyl-CoA dehydrogenase n=1 Tax=mine drainage metagenome TaxID=410659 RepID=A0A1J5R7B0_9ZZZZ